MDYTAKDGITAFKKFSFPLIKESAQNFAMNMLMKNNGWLRTIGTTLVGTKAFRELARANNTTANELATKWHLNSFRTNGEVKFSAGPGENELSEHALAFMFDNNDAFKHGVINSLISYNYLSDKTIKSDDFQKIFYDKDKHQHLSAIQKDINDDNFLVIDQMIKQKLSFNWSVAQAGKIKLANLTAIYTNQKVDSTKTQELKGLEIDTNNKKHVYINTIVNADLAMQETTSSIYEATNYGDKRKKILKDSQYSSLLNVNADGIARIKFNGITTLPGGKGILKFDYKSLKEATGYHKWDGFLQDGRLVRKNISFFPEDSIRGPLSMKRFQALMPIYVNGKFEIPDFAQTLALEVAPAAGSTKGIVNNGVLRTTAHAMIPPVAGVAAVAASTGSPAVVGVTAIAQVPEVTGIAATANLAKLKQLTWLLANNPKV
ncbi:MAG: hypothetical protein KAG91_02010, partial [Mycoplasmataceae bacterium]|nr:hypothetical protein [Mycoplasmataceae bacterium]